MSNATESTTTSLGLVVVSSCQIIFGIVGMFGNTLCFLVLRRQSEKNHTNWLIINQCAADFLTSCLLIAAAVHFNWYDSSPSSGGLAGELFCRLWDSRVIVFAGFAISTFNLTAISVERYVAVVHPMVYMTRFKRKTLYAFAATAWLMGPILQAVLAATHFEHRDGSCHYIPSGSAVGVALFIWEYFLPVLVIGYSFVRIALKLRGLNRVGNASRDTDATSVAPATSAGDAKVTVSTVNTDVNGEGTSNSNGSKPKSENAGNVRRRNITITLLIIYVTYLVCWTPNQFVFLVFNFGVLPDYIGSTGHIITTILATLNTCINPIVYAFKYKAFRRGLRDLFSGCIRGNSS